MLTTVALVSGAVGFFALPASAASTVTVRVVIEAVSQNGCTDTLDGSDFYGRTTIAGQSFDFPEVTDEDEIAENWTAEKVIDVNTTSTVSVSIKILEADGFLNFGTDGCDITSNDGTVLDLTVALIPCAVSGEATGPCVTPINTSGNGEGDGDANVRFRVEVDEPASAPGLNVRCMHSPLWPQPGDNVTITVESLDGDPWVGDTQTDNSNLPGGSAPALEDHTKIAEHLEVWVGDRSSPDLDVANQTTATFTVNNVPAGDLVYSCRVRDGSDAIFTGWRRTRVGAPTDNKAVPVIYTGERANRLDVVFIADADSYTSPSDPNFLSNIASLIKGSYYGQDYFLANQQSINFWLAHRTGDADAGTPSCMLAKPAEWDDEYSWKNTGAIIHSDRFRDCASGGVFSTEFDSLGTALHETGHSPMGLADEYAPDGGYFESSPFPDIYDTLGECQADAPNLGTTAAACFSWVAAASSGGGTWFTSEPTPGDLMNSRRPPNAADIRRMDWFFNNCRAGQC